jgi:hypothetical protein
MEQHGTQVANMIYQNVRSIMKFTLDMEEQKYPEKGRNDDRYKFFKKQLMSFTYQSLRDLFDQLQENGLIEPTKYEEDVKDGYKPTPSGGSGFINTPELDEFLIPLEE